MTQPSNDIRFTEKKGESSAHCLQRAGRPLTLTSHLSPLTVISSRPIHQYHSHPLAASLSPSTSNHPRPLEHPPLPSHRSISDYKLERGLEMSGQLSDAARGRMSRHNLQFGSKPITNKQIVDALMPYTTEKIARTCKRSAQCNVSGSSVSKTRFLYHCV